MKREEFKDITLEGRQFRIRKFAPDVGCYWASKFFGTNVMGVDDNLEAFSVKIQNFINKSRTEFKEFHSDCLKHVYEVLNKPTPVLNADGNYGVHLTGPLLFQLVYHSFMFTIIDFFTEGVMSSLSGSIAVDSPTGLSTEESMNSSTPQLDSDTGSNTSSGTTPTL